MSPRLRVLVIVASAAVAVAAAVLGITLATRQTPSQPHSLPGKPGVPTVLPTPAAGRIRAAFRSWPHGSLDSMEELGREYPRDAVVQLYLGVALAWAGYDADAATALRAAKAAGRDTPYEIAADDLLHPQFFRGYPVFRPIRPSRLLEEGSRLQAQGHQHSAERVYVREARAQPGDAEAQVAAAVGRFDKDDLVPAFSRLGPLTRRFPRSQPVRYYVGLLLAWTGQRDAAVAQFEKAAALDRRSTLGRSASDFLARLEKLRAPSKTRSLPAVSGADGRARKQTATPAKPAWPPRGIAGDAAARTS
jgi:tetratricopeptide (TPR) repeat protein